MHRTRAAAVLLALSLGTVALLVHDDGRVAVADDDSVAPRLVNASFEDAGDAPAGWEIVEGASSGGGGNESEVALDRTVAKDGKASLRLSCDTGTAKWRMVRQEIPVAGGDWVRFRVAARARGLDFGGARFRNANGVLEFLDAQGAQLSIVGTNLSPADCDWSVLSAGVLAPAGAAKLRVGLFSSIPGTLWFDDATIDVAPAEADTYRGRARLVQRFHEHFLATYPFFGMAGRPTAPDLILKHGDRLLDAAGTDAWIAALRTMLIDLGDLHVSLDTPRGKVPTVAPSSTPPNWNFPAAKLALTDVVAMDRNLLVGRIGAGKDAIGYALLGTWQLDAAAFEKITAALDLLADAKALVIDVRANGGGDETWAARVAGRFASKDVVFSKVRYRDPAKPETTDAFLPPSDKVLKPLAGFATDTRPVVVLQGPHCVSSNEAFVQMMAALPSVTTVGLPTRGASANPAPYDLLPGFRVWVPRWQALDLDGKPLEGRGIPPKVRVEAPAGSHAKTDPTLEKALEILRK